MIPNCFQIYFQPIYIYVKRSYELAIDNNYALTIVSALIAGIAQTIEKALEVDIFGVSNVLLLLVIATVLVDAYFGVRKSVKISKEAFVEAQKFEENTPEYKKWMKVYEIKKFDAKKLQYTFFKCFTLLCYLFVAKHLLSSESDDTIGQILGFTSAVVLRIPLTIFWYYDFKSIGENSGYVYGKKAPIFTIVEKIFEPKISNFFKSNNDESNRS